MNTTISSFWKRDPYLDTLGSFAIIAASVLIPLTVAVAALSEATTATEQVGDACPTTRFSQFAPPATAFVAAREAASANCA